MTAPDLSSHMNRRSLHPFQLELLNLIEVLRFGRVEGLHVRGRKPWFDPAPNIVQEIRLCSDAEACVQERAANPKLKSEFERLFAQLERLGDGIVDIEVRHSIPFKLAVIRSREELLG